MTSPDDMRTNTARLLCLLALSVLCWVFVHTSFLCNPKKNLDIYRWPKVVCTIIIPWGKYCYIRLPMGASNSPKVFQHKMNDSFQGFEFIRAYIYALLILTKGYWSYHVQKLELTLNTWRKVELNVILKIPYSEKPKWNI